jgi:secondary thiamine-phosphate synthase enzyme
MHHIYQPSAPKDKKGGRTRGISMRIHHQTFTFSTEGEIDFVDLTGKVREVVSESGVKNGLVHVFAPHATGVIVLTEYESGLLDDIKEVLEKLIPRRASYGHPSNAHSHLRSMFLCPDRTLPIVDGRVALGTWQSLFFIETDVHPRRRTVIVKVLGE